MINNPALSTLTVLAAALLGLAPMGAPATTDHRITPSTNAAPPVRFGTVKLPGGMRLHYAEQGGGTGDALILLHGYSDSWFSFSPILPLLPAGQRVYALDLRGHGDSDRPARGYTTGDLAGDVIAFMKVKNVSRATVVGHSLGSFVAREVARVAPERVARLVLVGSASALVNMNGFGDFEKAIASLSDPVSPEFIREFQLSTIHRTLPADFVDRVCAESRKLPARVWQGIFAGMFTKMEPAPVSSIPTLIIWGDRDTIFSRSEQDALLEQYARGTLRVYPETGHAVHWERPEMFARDLAAFLAQ